MTDLIVRTDINIRSPRYFIARTVATCWRCRASTAVFGLGLPPGHEALESDDAEQDDGSGDTWHVADHNALLFYVDQLSEGVQRRLSECTSCYRIDHSKAETQAGAHWTNHCERCGSVLDDQELFCEPDVAFLPTSEAKAGLIHLLAIDEALEARVAGYAVEPQFFDW